METGTVKPIGHPVLGLLVDLDYAGGRSKTGANYGPYPGTCGLSGKSILQTTGRYTIP